MNTLNKVLVVVSLLLLIAALVGVALLPEASLTALRGLVDRAKPLAYAPGVYILWAVSAGLVVLAVLLLVLELRRPQRLTVEVGKGSGGVVELSIDSVRRSLEYHISQVPGVTQVRPQVTSLGRSVRVTLDLETDPQADVPSKGEEVVHLARELVEGKLGLKMASGGLRVSVRQAAYSPDAVAPAVRPPAQPQIQPQGQPQEQAGDPAVPDEAS